jgi:hypothetical protein
LSNDQVTPIRAPPLVITRTAYVLRYVQPTLPIVFTVLRNRVIASFDTFTI